MYAIVGILTESQLFAEQALYSPHNFYPGNNVNPTTWYRRDLQTSDRGWGTNKAAIKGRGGGTNTPLIKGLTQP